MIMTGRERTCHFCILPLVVRAGLERFNRCSCIGPRRGDRSGCSFCAREL